MKNMYVNEEFTKQFEFLGWNKTDLARVLGVSYPAIKNWLDGTSTPTLRNALLLEHLLAVPLESWFADFDAIKLNSENRIG